MAIVSDTTISGGLGTLDKRYNRRFFAGVLANVTKKRTKFSRLELKNFAKGNQMYEANDAWNSLSVGDKSAWGGAGLYCGLGGNAAFVQDKIYRQMNGLPGNGTPSVYHQYLIGHLGIPEGAGRVLLRMVGSNLTAVPETLSISRKIDLVSENGGSEYLKLIFSYVYDPGAGEVVQTDEFNLNLNEAWGVQTFAPTQMEDVTGVWTLDIDCNLVHGDFWFDNLYVFNDREIFTKDPYCLKPDQVYNRVLIPDGVIFETAYHGESV